MSHSSYEIRKLVLTSAYLASAVRPGNWFCSVDLHEQTGEVSRAAFYAWSMNGWSIWKYKPKQVQAAVIQMADRTKVELFITFDSGRSSPIVLLNLRSRNWGFGTCSQGHCRCLLQQVLLEREQDAGERSFTIQKDIAKTCSYSSPQLNFAIYEGLAQQVVRLGWR